VGPITEFVKVKPHPCFTKFIQTVYETVYASTMRLLIDPEPVLTISHPSSEKYFISHQRIS